MKWMGASACFLLSVDCLFKAVGIDDQSLFAPDALWAWWIGAAGWFAYSIAFATQPTE